MKFSDCVMQLRKWCNYNGIEPEQVTISLAIGEEYGYNLQLGLFVECLTTMPSDFKASSNFRFLGLNVEIKDDPWKAARLKRIQELQAELSTTVDRITEINTLIDKLEEANR